MDEDDFDWACRCQDNNHEPTPKRGRMVPAPVLPPEPADEVDEVLAAHWELDPCSDPMQATASPVYTVPLETRHLVQRFPFETSEQWPPDKRGDRHLQINLVRQIYEIGPFSLAAIPKAKAFMAEHKSPGVYLLFYCGGLDYYGAVRSTDARLPIYVGVSAGEDTSVMSRVFDHIKSFTKAGLPLSDFTLRFMMLPTHWAKAAEDILIKLYAPIWNGLGFGSHAQGSTRETQAQAAWEVLHGRAHTGKTVTQTPEAVRESLRPLIETSRAAFKRLERELGGVPRNLGPENPEAWKCVDELDPIRIFLPVRDERLEASHLPFET